MYYFVYGKYPENVQERICPHCGQVNYSPGQFLCCSRSGTLSPAPRTFQIRSVRGEKKTLGEISDIKLLGLLDF
jgi:hypothetical protein